MEGHIEYSLVVMTHERPEALARCLESIRRLEQPQGGFEVIVVDDGSSRRALRPLDSSHPGLRLRYEWIPHQGVAAARNAGARLAGGSFVAFIADDYTLPPDYLVRAGELFARYPEASVLTFNVRSVGPGLGRHVQQLYHELVLLQNAGALPDENGVIVTDNLPASRAAVFRREVLERVGPFDERLKGGEDGDMGHRLAAMGIPLLFVHGYFIDHHEEKGFLEFLRQRREYATSYYRLVEAKGPPRSGARWTLGRCARAVLAKLGGWVPVSRRYGRFSRFCLLSPGLALFLSRFYLTLRALERAERVTDRGVLTRIRAGLHAATRPGAVRRPTVAGMEILCRLGARVLRARGLASAVFARGSYVTDGFRPFISDIDLAILVPRANRDPYQVCRSLHRRMRLVRAIQPFVRDPWQTILPETQWGLVERYGYLYGADDWRPIAGEPPWSGTGVPDVRLMLAASWNRQHLWTVLAQRQALKGETALRQLGASLKKARSFRARILQETGGRDGNGGPLDRPGSLLDLADSARSLESALRLNEGSRTAAGDARCPPTESESRAMAVLSAGIDLDRDVRALVSTQGFLCLVAEPGWSRAAWASALAVVDRAHAESGLMTFLYSQPAFSFAPLLRPIRVLQARPDVRLPSWPRLLEEQLLYQGLYQATDLWVAAGRSDAARALAPHVARAAELCRYFLTGEPRREPPPLADSLVELRELDRTLAARLPAPAPAGDWNRPAENAGAAGLFATGEVLTERLAELLRARDARARELPAATVS